MATQHKRPRSPTLHAATAFYLGMCVLCLVGSAQSQGSGACPEEMQPVLEAIDPPSGNERVTFEITGSLLTEVATIELLQGETSLTVNILAGQSDTAIRFTISGSIMNGLATLTLIPNNVDCQSPSVLIDLREGKSAVCTRSNHCGLNLNKNGSQRSAIYREKGRSC